MTKRPGKAEAPPPVILWFRGDLRVQDHAALDAATAGGHPVLPVYVLDDETPGQWSLGGASRWWLHHSLASLGAELTRLGAPLVLRRGRAAPVLADLAREIGAMEVHAGRQHEPWARQATEEVRAALAASGATLNLHRTQTLFDLDGIHTKTGGIYGVYTPFAKQLRSRGSPGEPLPAPRRIATGPAVPSDALESWNLLPTKPDWSTGFNVWRPGEAAAHARLRAFLDRAVHGYDTGRNLPGQEGTSGLSAHLHWGEISPRQVWHVAEQAAEATGKGLDTFLNEILWREFSAYLLFHRPDMPEVPMRPAFAALPFRDAPAELQAWQRGRTGIPVVDAGMRQLWQTGWMHNRVRMIAASFLVKQLLMDWRAGEDHFWDTLVDADLASNAASWQWIAGSGIDSQPFFRVFNPVGQGEKWDPEGIYVRKWVPELAALPAKYLHAPWTAPADVLAAAGVALGTTYPRPLVDLAEARNRALDAYRRTVKGSTPAKDPAGLVAA